MVQQSFDQISSFLETLFSHLSARFYGHLILTMPNAFDHMEFCSVINLTTGGNQAVIRPPTIATRYVSFATTLNTR